ncbi:xanthine dehydrogenase accessory protein XdhC [Phenylobacterium sp.]|uniref:xanthine dehydrogenase accessory protein XdhC n=1 Tax=Phenylobacterium sp. TaxID=1871053 RepID=UPI00121458C9|nr:xanthine dehydrogenase accessory protein XdhC [Phenylobacterium sp.]THD62349.1 MAG: xanthine dehydrogenase accessory protein XdhC [Phenylobacterium sp.]
MSEWIAEALGAVTRGEALAMATVVGAQGSTPREIGARMLVWPDRFTGTIGGGSLERQALDQARKLLFQDARRHALQDYPLGPLLGQCCGGRVRLLVERIDAESLVWLSDAALACDQGAPFRLQADIDGGALQRSVQPAAAEDPADNSPRIPIPDVRSLSEAITPKKPRLVIFGAGHVGQAVARAFGPLPFHLDWLASREDLRPEADGTHATIMAEAELEARVAAAAPGTLFAIFTHSHDLDFRLTRAVLAKGDQSYLGLIGSHTKRTRFERRLRDEGFGDADLARLTCPIGIPSLKSKAPAVIAIALAAELLQLTEEPET